MDHKQPSLTGCHAQRQKHDGQKEGRSRLAPRTLVDDVRIEIVYREKSQKGQRRQVNRQKKSPECRTDDVADQKQRKQE